MPPADLFESGSDNLDRGISGVVFCPCSIGSSPSKRGSDLVTIHNPKAARPFDRGLIDRGIEYWVDGFHLGKLDRENPVSA